MQAHALTILCGMCLSCCSCMAVSHIFYNVYDPCWVDPCCRCSAVKRLFSLKLDALKTKKKKIPPIQISVSLQFTVNISVTSATSVSWGRKWSLLLAIVCALMFSSCWKVHSLMFKSSPDRVWGTFPHRCHKADCPPVCAASCVLLHPPCAFIADKLIRPSVWVHVGVSDFDVWRKLKLI